MKKIAILTVFLALVGIGANAQNEIDALRYSNILFGGTARFVGLGGAFGALGADVSTLSTNPAGLGVFRTSEFSFTPSIYTSKTASTYLEKTREDIKYNFNFGNIGFVSTYKLKKPYEEQKGWEFINFGFGLNRCADFNNRYLIEGNNYSSSLITDYLARANGKLVDDLDPFDTKLAYDAYLIDPIDTLGNYSSVVPVNGGVKQSKSITTSGSMNEMVVSLGGNYNDQFYIGGTIGFPFIRYNEQSTYRELDIDTISTFKTFSLNEDISTVGSGVNFKLGMIFKPIEYIRLGVAVHTPTFFTMKDNYSRSISSEFDDGRSYLTNSPNGKFNYELNTPMRLIGSIGFVIGEYGIVSADYEFVDYSESRLRSSSYKFFEENDAVQNNYRAQSNIRLGAEVRLEPISIRGGYGIFGSPYNAGINDAERTTMSFGIGFREKDYYMDIAYLYSKATEKYYLYNPLLVKPVSNNFVTSTIMLTLGVKF